MVDEHFPYLDFHFDDTDAYKMSNSCSHIFPSFSTFSIADVRVNLGKGSGKFIEVVKFSLSFPRSY